MDAVLGLLDKSPGAIVVLVVVLTLFLRGFIVTGTACDARAAKIENERDQLRKERDEWKDLAMAGLDTGQRALSAAERRLRAR